MSAIVFVLGSSLYYTARLSHLYFSSGQSLSECIEFLILEERRNKAMSTESISSCEYAYKDFEMLRATTPEISLNSEVICSCSFPELQVGNCFIVSGKVLRSCERFSINLMCGNNKQDIALHFNPRLPQNYIVRNSRVSNSWQKEEVSSEFPFDLFRGHKFTIDILVAETEYLIGVNGNHFGRFTHRVPFKKVNSIEVKGDVKDIEIDQVQLNNYPQVTPSNIPKITGNPPDTDNNEYLQVPYYGRLSEAFTRGKTLHIKGRVKMLPHSFTINLQENTNIWPHPLIPLHFNPRFGNQGGRHVICRNSWVNGRWGKEERTDTQTYFMPGKMFLLSISCQDEGYQIYLNGQFFAEYFFKCDPQLATMVCVHGDIKLKGVYLASPKYD